MNPDSPLANVSLPPRPGLDPNRKPISLPSLEPTTTPVTKYTTRSSLKRELREQMKASKRHKKSGRDSTTVLCAQVDTEMLRAQGYKVHLYLGFLPSKHEGILGGRGLGGVLYLIKLELARQCHNQRLAVIVYSNRTVYMCRFDEKCISGAIEL